MSSDPFFNNLDFTEAGRENRFKRPMRARAQQLSPGGSALLRPPSGKPMRMKTRHLYLKYFQMVRAVYGSNHGGQPKRSVFKRFPSLIMCWAGKHRAYAAKNHNLYGTISWVTYPGSQLIQERGSYQQTKLHLSCAELRQHRMALSLRCRPSLKQRK